MEMSRAAPRKAQRPHNQPIAKPKGASGACSRPSGALVETCESEQVGKCERAQSSYPVWWAILPRMEPPVGQDLRASAFLGGADAHDSYRLMDGVAVIELAGVLGKDRSWFTDTSMRDAQRQVERAVEDPAVNAILLNIDSPGGTVAGTSDLAEAVFAARQRKPVVAYISDLGASAAYYVASQAGRIYGDTDALVGSIGVYTVVPDFSAFYSKEGIKVHVIRAGEMKGAGQPGTEVTDAQLADFQREIDQLNDTFLEAVARGRGWTRERVERLNDGRVHVGRHAVELGLLDGVMSFGAVLEGLKAQAQNRVRAVRAIAEGTTRDLKAPLCALRALRGEYELGNNAWRRVAGREHLGGSNMSTKLRKYLESIGLKASATEAQAWAFLATLEGEQAVEARRLAAEDEGADAGEGARAFVDEDGDGRCDNCGETEENCTCESGDGEAAAEDGDDEEEENQARGRGGSAGEGAGGADAARLAADARAAERRRVTSIINLGSRFGMPEAWIQRHIVNGTSVRAVKDAILERQAATRAPVRIAVGEDLNRSTIAAACADALLAEPMRRERLTLARMAEDGRLVERPPHPRAARFTGMSASEICRAFLAAHGVPVAGVHRNRIAQMIFDRSILAAHGTSDFPQTLANTLGMSLTRQYQELQPQWPLFCVRGTAPDFKAITRVSFGEVPNLEEVKEGEEYTEFTIGERAETYSLVKRGKKFALTWEAIVNDALDAFMRIPSQMIVAARRGEDDQAFGVLTTNADMADEVALFHADHDNLASTTAEKGAPTVARLNLARAAMATQTGISEDVTLNLVPRYILAPWALSGTIDQLLNSIADPAGTHAGVANTWNGKLTPIYNARLDASSVTAWYLACDPSMIDTIEVGFLAGYESPTIQTIDAVSPDRREFYIKHICTAKALDWRGLRKNPGA